MTPCFFCKGPAHPATGCEYSPTCIVCGPCIRELWSWVKGFTNRSVPAFRKSRMVDGKQDRGPKLYFYEHAGPPSNVHADDQLEQRPASETQTKEESVHSVG